MSKINNNKIIYHVIYLLGILAILALGLITTPKKTGAQYYGTYNNSTTPYSSYGSSVNYNSGVNSLEEVNPKPNINSLNPNYSNLGVGTKTVTITGSGFTPSSVARINDSSRPITFIDPSHLLVQITGNDTYAYRANGGFFISVFNRAPGGGYSNAIFFTINNGGSPIGNQTNNGYDYSTVNNNFQDATPIENQTVSNLAGNVIFGENTFTPSGITQWVFFGILILLIVIFVRKIFGGEKRYHETPLKHL